MNSLTSLFLSQSYQDTWDDYNRSLTKKDFARWDYVILTASNEKQAESFKAQIDERRKAGFLPKETHFAVIPDPCGKRVGSGGATLGVIKYIAEHTGRNDFKGLRVLVIHSGGDSKRVPQYSALGKLFSPVPHKLPNGRSSTLFDEFMICMSSVAGRVREGMVLLSGDVLLLFNPLQIDFSNNDAVAISFKEDVKTGKNHGVFAMDDSGYVSRFLHKQTEETLQKYGAVNERGCVDIDTGAVIFPTGMVSALYSLISENGIFDEDKYKGIVNDKIRLSLYADFLYPLAKASTLEDFYNEKPEGSFSDELKEVRKKVWEVLLPYKMKLLRLAPAKFIHFGTTKEILKLMSDDIENYDNLGWAKEVNSSISEKVAGYNSILSQKAQIGDNCYLEDSHVHSSAIIGNNVLLSYVDVKNATIPDDVVLHGLKQTDGKFVARIYGINDNPKSTLEDGCTFFATTLSDMLSKNDIDIKDLWETEEHSLWNAKLYPACDTIEEAIKESLNLYDIAKGSGDKKAWLLKTRKSLCSGFNDADPKAIIDWDNKMQELVKISTLVKLIYSGKSASETAKEFSFSHLTKVQKEFIEYITKNAEYNEKMRVHYYLGKALGTDTVDGEKHIAECFKSIQEAILKNTFKEIKYNETCKIVKDNYSVKLPLRVNWGGAWSDTPPYCMENGGTVLNASILLNGKRPVEVSLKKIDEKKIVFDSRDMDVHGEFTDIKPLQKTGDPYDPFALQKAALIACGVLPRQGGNLDEILTRLGGGFVMNSEVTGVPKGSGLGTSSILSAACVKAIFDFVGITYTQNELYDYVLCMEQIMSTGGGWQDQVGGLTNGIKYNTSKPGINQQINVENVKISDETQKELNERFALIYTGQRRLARNILRDVVGRYVGSEPESLKALAEIQIIAENMKSELESGNVDAFAKLLDKHWELSKKIDMGTTNRLIDHIFLSVDDLIDGKLAVGAGGGGFLQVVLKKNVTKEDVHKRLKEVFGDSDIDIWDCELV